MSVFAALSALLDTADASGTLPAARVGSRGGGAPELAPGLAVGVIARVAARADGGETRLPVGLVGGRVYTVELHTVPRGGSALLGLYGPAGDLIGSEGGRGRVRLALTAPATGTYAVSAQVAGAGETVVLRVLSWSADEVTRAREDPLYVL